MNDLETITVANLPIEITRKRGIKNLYIRVHPPDGKITVNAPSNMPTQKISLSVLKKFPTIEKVRRKILSQNRQSARECISGDIFYLWGKPYVLQVIFAGNKRKLTTSADKIEMVVPAGTSFETRNKLLTEWYRSELKKVLPPLALKYEQLTGLHADEFRIKNLKTRWGSCSIAKRRIWINLQLAEKPLACLEYIIIHELVHLLEKNHTPRFYALLERFRPTWREEEKILSEFPLKPLTKNKNSQSG